MENTNLNAKTVIAIPTYNERENLEWIIEEVLAQAPGIHILIVDDNSPDGTGQRLPGRIVTDLPGPGNSMPTARTSPQIYRVCWP